MMKSKTELNIHATRYISLVFESTLIKEGFCCPNNKKIHWYRRNGEDLLDCISFETLWSRIPIYKLDIRYEVIPLFLKPHYSPGVSHYQHSSTIRPGTMNVCIDDEPGINPGLKLISNEIQVVAPTRGSKGLYALTNIVLPYFARVKSLEECYEQHMSRWFETKRDVEKTLIKEWQIGKTNEEIFMYKDLLDEAIYLGDDQLCDISKKWILRMINSDEKASKPSWDSKIIAEAKQHWRQLYHAIFENAYEEYIEVLQAKKAANLKWLNRFIM